MKKSEIQEITHEVHAVERGEIAPARVREVKLLPGGAMRRVELDPETYRRKQARAWKSKTEAAKVRHELDLTQQNFAAMLGVSLATIRKWERCTGRTQRRGENVAGCCEAAPGGDPGGGDGWKIGIADGCRGEEMRRTLWNRKIAHDTSDFLMLNCHDPFLYQSLPRQVACEKIDGTVKIHAILHCLLNCHEIGNGFSFGVV